MFHEHFITISSNQKMDTAWSSIRTGPLLSLLGYKASSPDYSRQSRKTVLAGRRICRRGQGTAIRDPDGRSSVCFLIQQCEAHTLHLLAVTLPYAYRLSRTAKTNGIIITNLKLIDPISADPRVLARVILKQFCASQNFDEYFVRVLHPLSLVL